MEICSVDTSSWSFVSAQRAKSRYGYVGLQNQGATCYMNSLMQQLYLIPKFRQGNVQQLYSFEINCPYM